MPSDSRIIAPSEKRGRLCWGLRRACGPIDADLTCLDLVHETASKPAIIGEDRCSVAERVPCGDRDGLLVTAGTDNRQHGAEQFIGMQ